MRQSSHGADSGQSPGIPASVVEAETATLNLLWLLSARELARNDADRAALVYGLDRELVTALRDATLREPDLGRSLLRSEFPEKSPEFNRQPAHRSGSDDWVAARARNLRRYRITRDAVPSRPLVD
jgi:hypothetical protein